MVAGNIAKKIKRMSDAALDAKVVQMLRDAAHTIRDLTSDNAHSRAMLKEYGRHKNRCEWTHHGACDCGFDDALKEHKEAAASP